MNKQKIRKLYEKIDYLESELDIALFEAKHQRNDIKRFLLLLIENDIPIPDDLINKYINKALVKPAIKLPFLKKRLRINVEFSLLRRTNNAISNIFIKSSNNLTLITK